MIMICADTLGETARTRNAEVEIVSFTAPTVLVAVACCSAVLTGIQLVATWRPGGTWSSR